MLRRRVSSRWGSGVGGAHGRRLAEREGDANQTMSSARAPAVTAGFALGPKDKSLAVRLLPYLVVSDNLECDVLPAIVGSTKRSSTLKRILYAMGPHPAPMCGPTARSRR